MQQTTWLTYYTIVMVTPTEIYFNIRNHLCTNSYILYTQMILLIHSTLASPHSHVIILYNSLNLSIRIIISYQLYHYLCNRQDAKRNELKTKVEGLENQINWMDAKIKFHEGQEEK